MFYNRHMNFSKAGVDMTQRPISKAAEMTKIALLVAMNCISAYIIIPLPFSLSPIAMQPFIIDLIGFLMTPKQAFMSMLVYILLGMAGLPVFTGGTSGPGKIFGPTGGYIIGFMVAVTVMAFLKGKEYSFKRYVIVGIIFGVPIIYLMGMAQLMVLTGMDATKAFLTGVLPFIPLDIVKCIGAAAVAGPIYRIFNR